MDINDQKSSRILTFNNIKPPVDGRCGFFVKRKQRYCKMLPAKGNKYCAEHLSEDTEDSLKRKRINCPLDPKHTVFEDNLSKHLKKCNATLKTKLPYYTHNINLGIPDFNEEENIALYQTPIDELKQLILKVKELCKDMPDIQLQDKMSLHPVLDDELKIPEYGSSVKKHLIQQASLVNILDDLKVLENDISVIEFGAGRGALSHWIQKAMKKEVKSKFFLVDRQHNRNKLDCYHKGEDQGPNFERLNIDIQHLNLGNVSLITENDLDICAVGKHLCGGATDLSLRCLFETKEENSILHRSYKIEENSTTEPATKKVKKSALCTRLHSILFALCCYHRCTWNTYVGTKYFTEKAFTSKDFHRITKMAGWATCGFERRHTAPTKDKDGGDNNFEEDIGEHSINNKDTKAHAGLGLTSSEQEDIGRMCKRIIDDGRLKYIRSHGYDAELVTYVNRDITPENIALCVKRCNAS